MCRARTRSCSTACLWPEPPAGQRSSPRSKPA
jgi:hypothetical protein